MKVCMRRLDISIKDNKMMESWGEGLFVKNDEEKRQKAEVTAKKVKMNFVRMMQSPKNNGTETYEFWAINSALGLTAKAGHNIQTKRTRY